MGVKYYEIALSSSCIKLLYIYIIINILLNYSSKLMIPDNYHKNDILLTLLNKAIDRM